MFWGALCGNGPVAFLPVSGTMTATKYVAILDEHLLPFLENQPLLQRYVFQQDNAPSHKARDTVAWLAANGVDVLDNWPPYSPDLNVIENMWAFLKTKIRRESITTKEILRARVQEIWSSPDIKDLCFRLTSSMPSRIAECIRNKGGYTKY
jgi:hypothetical protein